MVEVDNPLGAEGMAAFFVCCAAAQAFLITVSWKLASAYRVFFKQTVRRRSRRRSKQVPSSRSPSQSGWSESLVRLRQLAWVLGLESALSGVLFVVFCASYACSETLDHHDPNVITTGSWVGSRVAEEVRVSVGVGVRRDGLVGAGFVSGAGLLRLPLLPRHQQILPASPAPDAFLSAFMIVTTICGYRILCSLEMVKEILFNAERKLETEAWVA